MDHDSSVDIHAIKNALTTFGVRLEVVYNALVGNEITKDGGLVKTVIEQKAEIMLLNDRIEAVEKQEDSRQQLIKIIWAIGSFLAAMILTLIVSHYFRQ